MSSLHAGDDISLTPLEPGHAGALFELVESNRAYLREWLPWLDAHVTQVDSLDFVYRSREQRGSNNGLTFGIFHKRVLSGVIGHNSIDWGNRNCQIGYWLAANAQGQGLMTKACATLVEHSFIELRLQRVEIRCASGNTRSRAIPERLGFVQEGLLRQAGWHYGAYLDLVVYGMTVGDWKNG